MKFYLIIFQNRYVEYYYSIWKITILCVILSNHTYFQSIHQN